MKIIQIIKLYILAFWALLGYWTATIPGITGEDGWAFAQPLYIMIPVLTLWYGTWFLIFEFAWGKIVGD